MRKVISYFVCAGVLVTPVAANAQFGGMIGSAIGKVTGKDGSDKSSSSTSPEETNKFLNNALSATVNVMIASEILSAAVKNKENPVLNKEFINGLTNAKSFKELGSYRSQFESNMDSINKNENFATDIKAANAGASANQKKLISTALLNLAIGIYRNVGMAQEAPNYLKGFGSDPRMLSRLGELKAAVSFLGYQAKALGEIAPKLTKVLGSMNLKPPAKSTTTQPVPYKFN